MFGLSLVALPIACAVAVLRYRLYEIDRIISRTLSYLIVSLLVAGTYAVVVTSVTTLLQDSNAVGGCGRHPGRSRGVPSRAAAGAASGRPPVQPCPVRRGARGR